jgi:two-component system OmpR family sensor kinase
MRRRAGSLRGRLLSILVALLLGGLLVADVVTYTALKSFLVRRVDEQLEPTALQVAKTLAANGARIAALGSPEQLHQMLPAATFVELRDQTGAVLGSAVAKAPGQREWTVRVPADRAVSLPPSAAGGHEGRLFTVAADQGAPAYRIRLSMLTAGGAAGSSGIAAGRILLVGLPLADVDATMRRLAMVEGAVTLAVLLLGAGLGLRLVRIGLRPLTDITQTANAITAGESSRRVAHAGTDSEVGQVGRALNTMLDQIETEMAERRASEERMRRFVGDASHELRTPLSGIRACAELFRRGAAQRPDDLAEVMHRIEDEAARMGILVDDLLLLARLDAGRRLVRQPVDLVEIARLAVGGARLLDPERPLTLDAGQPVPVIGDPHRLRQVVDNLLANVRAHTPACAAAQVHVGTAESHAVLTVTDTGPGIPPDQAARVFDRFFRADASRSRDHGGTGLGLSVVAAITKAHGGTVKVTSSPGQGAVFTVQFPFAPMAGQSVKA